MTPNENDDTITIRLRDVYDGVKQLQLDVSPLRDVVRTQADHEERIRSLEKWAYALPPTFLLALVSAVVALVKK